MLTFICLFALLGFFCAFLLAARLGKSGVMPMLAALIGVLLFVATQVVALVLAANFARNTAIVFYNEHLLGQVEPMLEKLSVLKQEGELE